MPQNQAVTIELKDSENLDDSSTQKPCTKEKFSWASLSKYLREAWTGVISGTGRLYQGIYRF